MAGSGLAKRDASLELSHGHPLYGEVRLHPFSLLALPLVISHTTDRISCDIVRQNV